MSFCYSGFAFWYHCVCLDVRAEWSIASDEVILMVYVLCNKLGNCCRGSYGVFWTFMVALASIPVLHVLACSVAGGAPSKRGERCFWYGVAACVGGTGVTTYFSGKTRRVIWLQT